MNDPRSPEDAIIAKIAADLEEDIVSGELRAGQKLPTEADLAAEHRISPHAARAVLNWLRDKGLVKRRQGSGTYVRDESEVRRVSARRYIDALTPGKGRLSREHHVRDGEPVVDVVPATAALAARLRVATGEEVLRRAFTLCHRREPVEAAASWIPRRVIPDSHAMEIFHQEPWTGGIIAQLKAIGVEVTRVDERVRVRAATVDEARSLGISHGSLILAVAREVVDGNRIVEAADLVYPLLDVELEYFTDLAAPDTGDRDPPPAREMRGGDPGQG